MKTIIGLVTKHKDTKSIRTLTYVCDEMKDVLFHNDAIAIGIVPSMNKITLVDQSNEAEIYQKLESLFTLKEKNDIIAQINLCNGIILSGGGESDAYEMWIAKYCYENDIPIIGICAGHNNMVRGIGGSTKKVENPEFHSRPDLEYVHSIKIDKTSNFYQFVNTERMQVNSRHKNTIDNPNMLTVVAYDDFGNIEVTEDKSKRCFLGMRFHPESLFKSDELHNRIFQKFIDICTKKKTLN